MLGKLNSKVLVVILVILVAAAVYAIFSRSNAPTSTIPDKLVVYDSLELNRLMITPKEGGSYELKKEGGDWKLVVNNKLVAIQSATLESALASLNEAKPKRVITRKQENWTKYELAEGEISSTVLLYNGDEQLAGVHIGKFDFNQQNRSMSTYTRRVDEDEVYLIDGPLAFSWNKPSSDWRDKNLISVNFGDITKVVSTTALANFSITKNELGAWSQQGLELDSSALVDYLRGVASISSSNFNDEADIATSASPDGTFEIHTDAKTIILSIYDVFGSQIVNSSDNPGSKFALDEAILEKILPQPQVEEELPEALEGIE